MKKRNALLLLILLFFGVAAGAGRLLINLGLLTSNLDGGGFSITNVLKYVATGSPGFVGDGSSLTSLNLLPATNNDTAVSNGIMTFMFSVSNSLWLSSSNLAWQATNGLGSAAFTASSSYDASGTAQAATNRLMIDASNTFIQITDARALTNNFATIPFAESLTNNFDTIVDVNAKLASATNNALALATNNDTVVSNAVFNFAQQQTNAFDTITDVNAKTNLLDTIVDVLAKLVSATNNALALATNNDTLTSQNTTNTPRLVINLASSFDTAGAALTATNILFQLTQPGYTWSTKITTPASGINYGSQMAFGNGQFLQIIGDGSSIAEVMYSTDGRNWSTNVTMPVANVVWKPLIYGGGQFISVASNSAVYATSPDGLHWTQRNASASDNWVAVGYGNGLYVACSATSPNSVFATSKGGQSGWSTGASIAAVFRALTFGGQLWVTVGDTGKIYTSPDATTWAIQTSPNSSSWTGVIYGNGLYVAWASAGTTTANSLITSTDGTNWGAQTISFAGPDSIAYGSGVFIGYKGGTGAMASPDGTNWTSVTGTISGRVNGAIYGNGLFVVSSGTESQTSWKTEQSLDVSGNIIQGGLIVRGGITNGSLTSADAIKTDLNGNEATATAILMTHIAQPGVIVTNGETQAITVSNIFTADAGHYFSGPASLSTITNTGLTSADAVATDSNGKEVAASAILMTHVAQPGAIVTNGNSFALTLSNNTTIDASHTLTAAGGATLGTATISSGGNIAAANIAWTGTNAGNATGSTNNQVAAQSANYTILLSDSLIPLNGARTATLPTAVGIPGRTFLIWCATSGTNAILTTSSQTINGAAKWTNTAQFKFTQVISDGANWRVIDQN